ncbi:hypothetical protein BJ166DRAFT_495334 [Pestalotiopsis sp. NC0098]|nr:hypothetical protein BJ166DRAFT_495334 [Pestalotiopsis sp. NC0098]
MKHAESGCLLALLLIRNLQTGPDWHASTSSARFSDLALECLRSTVRTAHLPAALASEGSRRGPLITAIPGEIMRWPYASWSYPVGFSLRLLRITKLSDSLGEALGSGAMTRSSTAHNMNLDLCHW